MSGIRTQHVHKDGSLSPVFEYLPKYKVVRFIGCWPPMTSIKQGREGMCQITNLDGTSTIVFNSDYDHITPLKPGPNDIF